MLVDIFASMGVQSSVGAQVIVPGRLRERILGSIVNDMQSIRMEDCQFIRPYGI